MIAVELEGRLGNQLFQYAFVYAAAKKLNTGFYIDKSVENFIPAQYFKLQNDFIAPIDKYIFSIKGFKNLFAIHLKKRFYKLLNKLMLNKLMLNNHQVVITHNQPADSVLKQLKNNCLYKGYFQSESFFREFKSDIKNLYQLKDEHVTAFKQVEQKFIPASKKNVAVHIRRGDYVNEALTLPLSYYKQAIAAIDSENTFYTFISDDPQFIEREFEYITNKYISTHNEIIDLQFLINANICILSNSSFSWWGAWLNNKQHKQLLAPQYWLGFNEQEDFPPEIADYMDFNWINYENLPA